MSISRVKPAGWGVNEKLTSAQQNALDINVTNALDKRAGQTDTRASNVTVTGTTSFLNNITFSGGGTAISDQTWTFGGGAPVTITTSLSLGSYLRFTASPFEIRNTTNSTIISMTNTAITLSVPLVSLTVTNNALVGGTLGVTGNTNLSTLHVSGQLNADANLVVATTLSVSGSSFLQSGFVATGSGVITNDLTIQDDLFVDDDATITGEVVSTLKCTKSISGKVVTVAFSATITLDLTAGNHFDLNTANSNTLISASNGASIQGGFFSVEYTQGLGPYTVSWSVDFEFGSISNTVATGNADRTIWLFYHNSVSGKLTAIARNTIT